MFPTPQPEFADVLPMFSFGVQNTDCVGLSTWVCAKIGRTPKWPVFFGFPLSHPQRVPSHPPIWGLEALFLTEKWGTTCGYRQTTPSHQLVVLRAAVLKSYGASLSWFVLVVGILSTTLTMRENARCGIRMSDASASFPVGAVARFHLVWWL